MTEPTRTIKIYEKTHPKLRLLAAMTGETMMDLVDRLIQEEKNRIGNRTTDNDLRTMRS